MSRGIITNYDLDNTPFYTTKVDDEQIMFKGYVDCNDVMIFAHDEELLFKFLKVDMDGSVIGESDVIHLESGSVFGDDKNEWGGIEVLGLMGQKVKFICGWS